MTVSQASRADESGYPPINTKPYDYNRGVDWFGRRISIRIYPSPKLDILFGLICPHHEATASIPNPVD